MRRNILMAPVLSCLLLGGCVWSLDFTQEETESLAPVIEAAQRILPVLTSTGGFILGGPAGAVAGKGIGDTIATTIGAVGTAAGILGAAYGAKKNGEANTAKAQTTAAHTLKIETDRTWDEAQAQARLTAVRGNV